MGERGVYRGVPRRRRVAGTRAGSVAPWLRAVLVLALGLLPPAVSAEGLLFRITGATGQGWLFGSLHFGSDDLYPLTEPVERAFAASERLMVEVDLLALDAEEIAELVRVQGHFPEDTHLRAELGEPLWQRLVAAAESVELAPGAFEQQRPWLAALTLATRFLENSGLRADRGVDRHFLGRAVRAGLPVLELETFASQLRVLSGLDAGEQRLMLVDTLAQVEQGSQLPVRLLEAWRRGNREALRRILIEARGSGPEGRALVRRLLDDRNVAMARRVAVALADPGELFVVVGAAHLLGERGLHRELERLGVLVEPR